MMIRTLVLFVLSVCAISPANSQEPPDVVADGIEITVLEGAYGSVSATNNGTLFFRGAYQIDHLVVDSTSRIAYITSDGTLGPSGWSCSGGGFGGRGGGILGSSYVHGTPDETDIIYYSNVARPRAGTAGDCGKSPDPQSGRDRPGGPGGTGGPTYYIDANVATIDGLIDANGTFGGPPPHYPQDSYYRGTAGGGGSGGSILIIARELHVGASAVFQANGGTGGIGPDGNGYSGGGGRIKLFYEMGEVAEGAHFEAKAPPEYAGMYLGPDGTWFATDGTIYIQQVSSTDWLVHPEHVGDLNLDGIVDSKDLFLLRSGWGRQTNAVASPTVIAPTVTPGATFTPTTTPMPTDTRKPTRTVTPTMTWTPTETP